MMAKDETEKLFRNNYKPMFILANRMLHDGDTARDIVHDVFSSILQDSSDSVNTSYLLNAVRYSCLKHIRSLSIRERFIKSYSPDVDEIESDYRPDEEDIAKLNRIIENHLSEKTRCVLRLKFILHLTYKKMTYDIYAGSDNQDFHHSGADNLAVYRLDDNGTPSVITRKETFRESRTRTDEYPLTFRASYYSPRFLARNTLSFTHYSSPEQFSCGDMSVDIHPESDYTFSRNSPNRNNTVYYNSDFYGAIGSNASFDIAPTFRHTHRNNISLLRINIAQRTDY